MNKKIFFIASCFIAAFLAVGFYPAGDNKTIALAVKVILDVTKKSDKMDWAKAKKGEILYSGDEVKTGERSIAIVKFLDNSMLRVREKSELKVFGANKDGKFSKTVHINKGEFTFDIQKQENEQFIFTSPTSVAAIRGTQGELTSLSDGDLLTVLEGMVSFLNQLSNTTVEVGAGETGFSGKDGKISKHAATADELNNVSNSINSGKGKGDIKELQIELKDKEGNKKLIKIRYRE